MKITYKVKRDGDSVKLEKRGYVIEFSMDQIKAHMEKLKSAEKALSSQIELEKAKQKNVEDHHEIVHVLTDEQMAAASIYYQSKGVLKQSETKLADVQGAIKEYEEELAEIEKQTGLTL